MSKLGKFVLIRSRADWQQACGELAQEIADQRGLPQLSIEFPRQPTGYPCLMAAIPVPTDPSLIDSLDTAQVLCSFVYPNDAAVLMEACQDGQTEYAPAVEAEAAPQYIPSPLAALSLALISELKAVGALKKSNLLTALRQADRWLADNQERNAPASVDDILERFWEACR